MRDPKRSGIRWFVAAALAVLSTMTPSTVAAASGDLDATFDTDGKITTAVGMGTAMAQGIVQQADGKLVVAGDGSGDFAVVRYLSNGSLDPGFDGDGIVTTNFGSADRALGIALQADGKLVVVGDVLVAGNADVGLARYEDDGSLDASFGGGDGLVTTPVGAATDSGNAVRIQSDGKIVVACRTFNGTDNDVALLRYEDDGTLDASFGGGDGIVTHDLGAADSVDDLVIDPVTGAITVTGYSTTMSDNDLFLVRFEADGTLDGTFDGDGIVEVDVGAADQGHNVVAGGAGGIYVSGAVDGFFSVLAFDAAGALDPAFAGDGIASTVFTMGEIEGALALARQPDGALVAAGIVGPGTNRAFGLARFLPDGTLDASFGTAGKVTTDFTAGQDFPWAMLLQSDGKIVAAGAAQFGSFHMAVARYENGPFVLPTPTPTATATPTPSLTPACGAPLAGCRTPVQGQKAILQTKDKSPDSKDQLQWKWSKGSATTKADFGAPGEPLASTSYQLCVFGDTDQPTPIVLFAAQVPAGGLCDTANPRPCWKEVAAGYNYKDKDETPDGVAQLVLRAGADGKAKIQLKASGDLLGDPVYPLVQTITVQLRNSDGVCWESVHSAPATKNTDVPFGQFKDKAD
jgi:uncharacterized delta-60 repeat protein